MRFWCTLTFCAAALTILPSGCGDAVSTVFTPEHKIASCDHDHGAHATATSNRTSGETVLLSWTGGTSPIFQGHRFTGTALDRFPLPDGTTLANHATAFKAMVRERVLSILCEISSGHIVVIEGPAGSLDADTTVLFTQDVAPDGSPRVGIAHYDDCNQYTQDSAIVFGERLRLLAGGAATLDEWVNVFANVAAHEVAHTLGYGHIPRRSAPPAAERPLFIELMLDAHTMDELKSFQRLMAPQPNCR